MPLSVYAAGLLALFILVTTGSAFYVRAQADADERQDAQRDAEFVAELVAGEVASALIQIESTVARTAAVPGIAGLFNPSSTCNLIFGGVGVFPKTRLDVIATDGKVVCSSVPAAIGVSHSGAAWLSDALRGATFVAPAVDKVSGHPSVVSTAPVPGRGTLAAFADLTDLGPTLGARFGREGELELLVTTADGTTALARSVDSGRWSGTSLDGMAFASKTESLRPDLDGRPRLYADATSAHGWRVYAGADLAMVSQFSTRLFLDQIAATLIGLIAVLLGLFIVYRRVVNPIAQLSRAVSRGTSPDARPVSIVGPSEITGLAQDFNKLISTVQSELADRRRAEARVRGMIDEALDAVVGMNQAGEIIEWSRHAEAMFGWKKEDVLNKPLVDVIIPDRYRAAHRAGLQRYRETGIGPVLGKRLELEAVARDGHEFPVELSITPVATSTGTVFSAFIRDISERIAAAKERQTLETQLHQAQRLESVGQLAGGIAHDFNNLIAVILNYATFVSDELGDRPTVKQDVEEIKRAAERAANLTRQLLIFSRREMTRPEVLELGSVIGEMRKLLQRSLGEHIELITNVESGLWPVLVDHGQLEQVVMNLAVNARDAMPRGGRLVISAANADLEKGFTDRHLNLRPGRYVRLEVGDTGSGMAPEVKDRAFEPFFTTKPKGQGTGLGLATVYGIVTQAGGTVSLYSELDRGTTVKILFPVAAGEVPPKESPRPTQQLRGKGETILLVEDEPAVRTAARRILNAHGYRVLEAGPSDAIGISADRSQTIDLVLTDVVMPEMSGIELAGRLARERPVRVLFMSGHSQEVVAHQGLVPSDGSVLEKPFTPEGLLHAVRDALLRQ